MVENLFKQLIIDSFVLSKKGTLVGIIYSACSTYGFSEIKDINEFAKKSNPDMLYLKSIKTDTEISIYTWDLESYKIDRDKHIIFVKLKNKDEILLNY